MGNESNRPKNDGSDQEAHLNNGNSKQQHQLQRALILAQKYNYSPAKLATSKLSSKLHLRELIPSTAATTTASNNYEPRDEAERQNGGGLNSKRLAKSDGSIKLRDKRLLSGNSPLAAANYDVTGRVQLDISYFARSGSLTVHLMQCSQLAPANKRRTSSNPYVKLYLLPDRSRSGKRKSSVAKHQLEPKFDQRFTFGPIQLHEFDARTLWLSVWHKDRGLSRNEFLGELYLPMSRVRQQLLTSDLCQSISSRWYQLTSPADRHSNTLKNNRCEQPVLRHSDGSLLTTKRPPLAAGRDEPVGETEAAKRLSEFEKKAARLTQQHHLFSNAKPAPASGDAGQKTAVVLDWTGAAQQRRAAGDGRAKPAPRGAAVVANSRTTGLSLNLDGPGQTPFKTMQVALGPAHSQQQQQLNDGSISGQLFVALKFVPESDEVLAKRASAQVSGNLHVLIKEARDIGGFKSDGNRGTGPQAAGQHQQPLDQLPSPFCKCILLDATGQRVAKQRTNQLRRTSSPRWDHELVFQRLKVADLQAQAIEIRLFNRDTILVSTGEHLGSIRLCKRLKDADQSGSVLETRLNQGDDQEGVASASNANAQTAPVSSTGSLRSSASSMSGTNSNTDDDLCSEREARLWCQMLSRPNIWVYGELPLRRLRPIVSLGAVGAD